MAIKELVLIAHEDGIEVRTDGRLALQHRRSAPLFHAGRGEAAISMHHGNFDIQDEIRELCPLEEWRIADVQQGRAAVVEFWSTGGRWRIVMHALIEEGRLVLRMEGAKGANRLRIALPAHPAEHVYGCGEQFSYFDLRGRRFPLWTSEQGVGRNKSTWITHQADLVDNAGGDYWWTFFPQPTFVSSDAYWVHMDSSAYAVFDFRRSEQHELYCWELPRALVFGQAQGSSDMPALLEDLSDYFGRQPELPEWVYRGVILGIQGGTEVCERKLRNAQAAGVPVAGIWAQDWEGINMTSFGQRLRWNWVWNPERYPGLDRAIQTWKQEGIRFLAYANCYVGKGWSLCEEAAARGYLVKNARGEDYYVDFGEFDAGIVDLTNPAAFDWYADSLVRNMINFGISGWMADFGEYLPTDAVLHDGTPALLAHNLWPALWARCNYEAVRRAGAQNEALYFMRAGFTGSQRWCPMMWAGDQNVDWSNDDGLPSAVRSALGLAMCGHGLHHSDIGGYTTLFGLHRTRELFMRWAEQAAFSPLMRTHEGNRPAENWQFDSDAETLAHLSAMAQVHVALSDYLRACVAENACRGIAVMRPLFLHYPQDPQAWRIDDEYLLGPDLLVAPVMTEGALSRNVHFPGGVWRSFWTKEIVWNSSHPGEQTIEAPIGQPPVFVRDGSVWEASFEKAAAARARIV